MPSLEPKGWPCEVCSKTFYRLVGRPGRVCGVECAIALQRIEAQREQARKDREWKKVNKKMIDYLNDAQKSFNAFIRKRDESRPCISCGRWHNGKWNAGHYRTTKAMPALRFNEINVHAQCEPCNTNLSGNITEYRIELVRRIGAPLVEWLEKDHPKVNKWTKEELVSLRDYYRAALKELENDPFGGEPF